MIVATNYTSILRATVRDHTAPILPIDIALTAIEVPAGASTIVLEPVVAVPWWARLAPLLGVALLVLASVGLRRPKA